MNRLWGIIFLLFGIWLLSGSNSIYAHSIEILDPFEMSLGDPEFIDHYDEDPWKGTLTLTVQNSGIDPWGDFHFQISNPTNGYVIFRDDDGFVPAMSGTDDYRYEIVNGGLDLNFFFYDDPVYQNESVTFSIYTDNTSQQLSFFRVAMEATPVPLPGAFWLLGSGLIGLAGFRKSSFIQ